MKASHWPLEKGDKVDISLRVMISVCICLHMCVCLRHISELYDKTHQHVTTRWNGGRRGRTDGGRDWKKMNDTRGRFYFSLSQWGPLGKVVRHNANMSVWIARWEEDSCLRWQRWLLMLNLSASPQTYSYTHSHNDHNELATKHKCATNTYTVHTCHLCMREWHPRFLCCAFMGKISCL